MVLVSSRERGLLSIIGKLLRFFSFEIVYSVRSGRQKRVSASVSLTDLPRAFLFMYVWKVNIPVNMLIRTDCEYNDLSSNGKCTYVWLISLEVNRDFLTTCGEKWQLERAAIANCLAHNGSWEPHLVTARKTIAKRRSERQVHVTRLQCVQVNGPM